MKAPATVTANTGHGIVRSVATSHSGVGFVMKRSLRL
jgi:hypothetical protein